MAKEKATVAALREYKAANGPRENSAARALREYRNNLQNGKEIAAE